MTHHRKHLIAATLLAALTFGAGAQTAPAAPAASAPGPSAGEHRPFDGARMREHMARRQAALKQKLQITPAQEGAWTAYIAAMQPPANMARPERGEFARLTTPERIERMRAMHAARSAEMDKRATATIAFYSALTPEQKKVFDAETAPRGWGGHRHGGPGHHRG